MTGFLAKNTDSLAPDLKELLRTSSLATVAQLFPARDPPRRSTLASQFLADLTALLETLGRTRISWIRCLAPNDIQQPGAPVPAYIQAQCRATGLRDAVQVRREGFPLRFSFTRLHRLFPILFTIATADQIRRGYRRLTVGLALYKQWAVGRSKVFMSDTTYSALSVAQQSVAAKRLLSALRHLKTFRRATQVIQRFFWLTISAWATHREREAEELAAQDAEILEQQLQAAEELRRRKAAPIIASAYQTFLRARAERLHTYSLSRAIPAQIEKDILDQFDSVLAALNDFAGLDETLPEITPSSSLPDSHDPPGSVSWPGERAPEAESAPLPAAEVVPLPPVPSTTGPEAGAGRERRPTRTFRQPSPAALRDVLVEPGGKEAHVPRGSQPSRSGTVLTWQPDFITVRLKGNRLTFSCNAQTTVEELTVQMKSKLRNRNIQDSPSCCLCLDERGLVTVLAPNVVLRTVEGSGALIWVDTSLTKLLKLQGKDFSLALVATEETQVVDLLEAVVAKRRKQGLPPPQKVALFLVSGKISSLLPEIEPILSLLRTTSKATDRLVFAEVEPTTLAPVDTDFPYLSQIKADRENAKALMGARLWAKCGFCEVPVPVLENQKIAMQATVGERTLFRTFAARYYLLQGNHLHIFDSSSDVGALPCREVVHVMADSQARAVRTRSGPGVVLETVPKEVRALTPAYVPSKTYCFLVQTETVQAAWVAALQRQTVKAINDRRYSDRRRLDFNAQ